MHANKKFCYLIAKNIYRLTKPFKISCYVDSWLHQPVNFMLIKNKLS